MNGEGSLMALGKTILERRSAARSAIWLQCAGVGLVKVFLGLGLILALVLREWLDVNPILPVAGVLLLPLAWMIVGTRGVAQVDLCEDGIRSRTWWSGTREIRLRDVREVAFRIEWRDESGGLETVTTLTVRGVRGRPIRLVSGRVEDPGELLEEAWRFAKPVAERMAGALDRGEPVDWTPALRLHPEGLAVRGAKGVLPWAEIQRFSVEKGRYQIRQSGGEFGGGTHVPNFIPGQIVLERILQARSVRPK
jgi:hypothetical protein